MTVDFRLPPIAATTVGSFPRPGWLATRERSDITFLLEGAALHEALDDAVAGTIHEQERIGLDLLTDGEQRRPSFINHILSGFEGIDLEHRAVRTIRRKVGNERLVPRIVGKVRRRAPIAVEDFRFARAQTVHPLKMAVPGPVTVTDTTYDEAYGDEAALAMDVAAALNEELLDLEAAGCDVIQIDEPAMTRYHEKTADYGVQALDRCLAGISIPTIVHLCYGYPGTGGLQHQYEYPELLDMLMDTAIGGFSLEFARSGYDPAILARCRGRLVMFGCIDPGDAAPEPVDVVVDRIRSALRYVEPTKLLIAPDCGLMTVSRELAREKAALLVRAATEVRRTL
jgi:5-methyltetrahydropteroyltriglutamate--homocysteine methyltransferase